MLDVLASVAGGLLGGSGVGGTGGLESGTDAAAMPPSNTTEASSKQKVANKSKSGGARLTITSTGGKGGKGGTSTNPLADLTDSGIPVWLVLVALVSIIALIVLALVLGG